MFQVEKGASGVDRYTSLNLVDLHNLLIFEFLSLSGSSVFDFRFRPSEWLKCNFT